MKTIRLPAGTKLVERPGMFEVTLLRNATARVHGMYRGLMMVKLGEQILLVIPS